MKGHPVRRARILTHATALLVGITLMPTAVAAPAGGAPGDDPCRLAIACAFLPIAPDLDGDVDLTKQLPPGYSPEPQISSLPPVNPCLRGCV
jgi:hypothetical protein